MADVGSNTNMILSIILLLCSVRFGSSSVWALVRFVLQFGSSLVWVPVRFGSFRFGYSPVSVPVWFGSGSFFMSVPSVVSVRFGFCFGLVPGRFGFSSD